MIAFIAGRIEKEAAKSTKDGKAKYSAYFVDTNIYASYREGVDAKLTADGYAKVIVK